MFEREQFEHEVSDIGLGGRGKGGRRGAEQAMDKARSKGKMGALADKALRVTSRFVTDALNASSVAPRTVLSESQKQIVDKVSTFVLSHLATLTSTASSAQLQFPNHLVSARDRRFLSDLADALKLYVTYDEYTPEGENLVTVRFDEALVALAREEEEDDDDEEGAIKGSLDGVSDEETEGAESSEAEEIGIVHLSLDGGVKHAPRRNGGAAVPAKVDGEPEWQTAIKRVLDKYRRAEVIRELSQEEAEEEQEKQVQDKIAQWKTDYYKVRATSSLPRAALRAT